MRLRVFTGDRLVQDVKIPKDTRAKFLDMVETIEGRREEWELNPLALNVADVKVDGLLRTIEQVHENGELIVVFKFWS